MFTDKYKDITGSIKNCSLLDDPLFCLCCCCEGMCYYGWSNFNPFSFTFQNDNL